MARAHAPRLPAVSARARIVLAFVLLLALAELLAIPIQRGVLSARAHERVEEGLTLQAEEMRALVLRGTNPETRTRFGGEDLRPLFSTFLLRSVPARGGAIFAFIDGRLFRSTVGGEPRDPSVRSQVHRLAAVTTTRRGDIRSGGVRLRYLAVPLRVPGEPARGGVFLVTGDIGAELARVDDAVRVSLAVSLLVLGIGGALAWGVAGRVLAPVRELTTTAREITDADLTRRIEVTGNDELAELARTFNSMIDRLEASFALQRQFVSDAGHELRTPITIIRGHLELLGDDPDERHETQALVIDELDRMARFVDDLLTLAKAERSDFLQPADVDLDALTHELMAKAAGLADREWELEAVGAARLRGDRQRLTQAVMNLAHNAVQHTGPGDRIALGSAAEGRVARLWVSDSGPGVAPGEAARIFDRFARGGNGMRRSDGAGLGLSIVRAIAEAHGGHVDVRSVPGEGATFVLELPLDPPLEAGAA
jgi:two-component system, OmpR family, sensor kinase